MGLHKKTLRQIFIFTPTCKITHPAKFDHLNVVVILLVIWSEFLGRPVWCQEMDSILVGPFQLRIFYDSVLTGELKAAFFPLPQLRRIIESLRLEKISKIIRSNHHPTTSITH